MAIEIKTKAAFARVVGEVGRLRLPVLLNLKEFSPGFREEFIDLTSEGFIPIIAVGHFSQVDAPISSELGRKLIVAAREEGLEGNLNRFVITVAKSVPNGKQGEEPQALYRPMEAYAKERSCEFLPFTRVKDRTRFAMQTGLEEMVALKNRLQNKGTGLILLAGGSVEPGRRRKNSAGDEVNGLQEITDKSFVRTFKTVSEAIKGNGQIPYFIPAAIEGSHKIFDPDRLTVPGQTILSMLPSPMLWVLGIDRIKAAIRVDMPLTPEKLSSQIGSNWMRDPQAVNDLMMGKIASLLPPELRGYYC